MITIKAYVLNQCFESYINFLSQNVLIRLISMVDDNAGWWVQTLWKILVNWDDDSQYMEKSKNVTNHQPVMYGY